MDNQEFQRDLASYEQEQQFLKHLTTLSTGSIILMVTFLEKLFVNPEWKVLVGISIISFLLSVFGCVSAHLLSVLDVDASPEIPKGAEFVFGIVVSLFAFGGFLSGVVALAIFSLKNLY